MRGLSNADIFRTRGGGGRGVFRGGGPFFLAKNFGFFKFLGVWCVRTDKGKGGVEPVRTFCGEEGRVQFFAILCGRILWTAPYHPQLFKATSKIRLEVLLFVFLALLWESGNDIASIIWGKSVSFSSCSSRMQFAHLVALTRKQSRKWPWCESSCHLFALSLSYGPVCSVSVTPLRICIPTQRRRR